MKNVSKLLLLCFLSFGIFSCSSDDDVSQPPIGDDPDVPNLVEAAEDGGLTTLLDAVGAVEGLGGTLLNADQITVFAPTNQAFSDALNAFEAESLEELVENIGGVVNLETVLGFHVVPAVAFSTDLQQGEQTFTTLADQEITVTVADGVVTVEDALENTATVINADIEIDNGVVHVIDAVLLPLLPEAPLPNLVEAAETAELNVLLDAVGAVDGLGEALLAENEITVFAPTDEAFTNLLSEVGVSSLNELVEEIGLENLETVLGFHVVPAVAFAEDLNEGAQTLTTLAGQDLTVTRTGNEVTVTDVEGNTFNVTTPNVAIENGVVHVIDGVLLPELASTAPSLVEAAQENGLTTLLAAIGVIDGLAENLLEQDAITVFAPTNDAFEQALVDFEAESLEELVAAIGGLDNLEIVLGFHVIPAVAFAEDIPEGDNTFPTLAGQDLIVNRSGANVTVTDATGATYPVAVADVEIQNGVVHVIDENVLVPELEIENSVAMTVENSGASAYFVSEIQGNEEVTPLNEDNSTWNLTVGTRYVLNVTGASSHPFALRNAGGDFLISQNSSGGSFENDADVNFQVDGNVISFTLTPGLANEVDNYVCTVHGSMTGSITVN